MNEILKKVSDTVLQEPVTITVDVNPQNRWQRLGQRFKILPAKRKFRIEPVKYGSLIRISKIITAIDMKVFDTRNLLESNYKAIELHGASMARIVAIAIQNNRSEPSESLVRFVLNNFTTREMMTVVSIVMKQMDITSFMTSIISIKGMNVLEMQTATAPGAERSEMSPENQGS